MSQKFSSLSDNLITFIEKQKIFFVGTGTADSRINISPKGMDSLRITGKNTVIWLNVTGSGNETSAHVQVYPRMTIMFMAFEGKPLILRLYGNANVIHKNDSEWDNFYSLFKPTVGARQIFEFTIDLVQTSCGMAVPLLDFVGERDLLTDWADKQGEQAIKEYWLNNNQQSIDGISTNIATKNS